MKNYWELEKHDYLHCIVKNNLTTFTYKDIFKCIEFEHKSWYLYEYSYMARYMSENLDKLVNDGTLTVKYHSEKRKDGFVSVPIFKK